MEEEICIQDISVDLSEDSTLAPCDVAEAEREEDSERSKATDETSLKTRSKRESRRMRELEQAQFSLELLKVRTTSIGGPPQEDSVQDNRQSPRGSPASHGSFELLSVEDMETEGSGGFGSQTIEPQVVNTQVHEKMRDSNFNEKPVMELPNKEESPRATFYIPSDQSPVHEPKCESPNKSYKDRRESTSRRPVVVLISMQKESPVEEGELLAAKTLEKALETQAAPQTKPVTSSEVTSKTEKPHRTTTQVKKDASERVTSTAASEAAAVSSSEVDIHITLGPKDGVPTVLSKHKEKKTARSLKEAPSPVLDTKPPKAQKKSSGQTVIVNMVEKPSNSVFSPPRRKLPFSK